MFSAVEEFLDGIHPVLAHDTAHAAIRDFDEFFGGFLDEIRVDRDFAEFVFHHSDFESVISSEDMIEKGCFTTSKESGDDGYWDHENSD